MIFENRREAGVALGRAVRAAANADGAVVLAVPRGGVPVGFEVASELQLPLDVFVVRKLGAPREPELAMGAVASGGLIYVNQTVVKAFGIGQEEIDAVVARELQEIERREAAYRGGYPAIAVEGRNVIVVDDGLATGSTMIAAVRALRPRTGRIIVAVPVAPRSACHSLEREADAVICLDMPEPFEAVGEFYRQFSSTEDAEVASLLRRARGGDRPPLFSDAGSR